MFQSMRPCGARHLHIDRRRGTVVVSIHAPVRGATGYLVKAAPELLFQSTRPCGARRLALGDLQVPVLFQSTRPCGARLMLFRRPAPGYSSFNPRARAGRDLRGRIRWVPRRGVSIHAPVRGATYAQRAGWPAQCGFNPRARAGRDEGRPLQRMQGLCFNPRARAGRDSLPCVTRPNAWLFQSTRPCGARRRRLPLQRRLKCFNPRARAGRDIVGAKRFTMILMVSIHAPVRGATWRIGFRLGRSSRFNPRARAGRDRPLITY